MEEKQECNDPTQRISATVIGNKGSSVFLKTAKDIVSDVDVTRSQKARILFDGCAQRSFITEKTSDLLNLVEIRRDKIIVKGFGCRDEEVKLVKVVKVNIMNLSQKRRHVIEVYVVPMQSDIRSKHRISAGLT